MALVNIFSVDFYMSPPINGLDVMYSEFRSSVIYQVPIIRIFGSSATGSKTCLHIHGVFPYIYIPFDGSDNSNAVIHQIASKLDQAINTAFGQASSNTQHVFKIVLVSGTPLYGYHAREHQFLKIYFYNPLYVKKAGYLLHHGHVLGKSYQLHEAHIPFILQFMIDYNLHGMNYISLSEIFYRKNTHTSNSDIPAELVLPDNVPPISLCQIEIDGIAENIINRIEIAAGCVGKNPGIVALWEDEKQRRRNKDEDSQISPCLSQTRNDIPPTDSHISFENMLKEKLLSKPSGSSDVNESTLVYPAETPNDKSFSKASSIESHFSQGTTSSSSSLDIDYSLDNDESIFDKTLCSNNLNDTCSKELLGVLNDLVNKGKAEEDSLLSQISKVDENSDEEDIVDMSLPLASITTPTKAINDDTLVEDNVDLNSTLYACPDIPKAVRDHEMNGVTGADIGTLDLPSQLHLSLKNSDAYMNQSSSQTESALQNDTSATTSKSRSTNSTQPTVKRQLSFEDSNLITQEDNVSMLADTKINNAGYPRNEINFPSEELNSLHAKTDTDPHSIIHSQNYIFAKAATSILVTQKDKLDTTSCGSSIKLTQKLSVLEVDALDSNLSNSSNDAILMPKFNPPSRRMITQSFSDYNIPQCRSLKPFYSNFNDATGEVQVGYNVLKIASASDLTDFQMHSSGPTLVQLRKCAIDRLHPDIEITSSRVKDIKLLHCANLSCTLMYSKTPPLRKNVKIWLQTRDLHSKPTIPVKEKKTLLLPLGYSPNAQNDSDNEECISLSPVSLSPVENCSQTVGNSQTTPDNNRKRRNRRSISREKSSDREIKGIENKSSQEAKLQKLLLKSQYLKNVANSKISNDNSCQITGASLDNTYGFKMSLENLQQARAVSEHQHLTIMVMELHIQTRDNFKPDPEFDPIRALFYSIFDDTQKNNSRRSGIIIADNLKVLNVHEINSSFSSENLNIKYVESEEKLIEEFVMLTKLYDPEICVGYEIEQLSWGYLLERGNILNINLPSLLSRSQVKLHFSDDEHQSEVKLTGRVLLNTWRLMRHEIALQSYTFENIVYHILHMRIPLYSLRDLSYWWEHESPIYRRITAQFYITKVEGILKILEQLDLIERTCELARLFGIQFYEVLSRGSQFRVESMMLRLAKPLNYIAVSPTVEQRAKMKAPEFLPLILEPESKLFTDPVIVLDFQSLYPSMIIAYNYCFSTCLGKVRYLGHNSPFEFGATQLKVSTSRLKRLLHKNLINYSPCGVAFVKPKVRQGILPRMLTEILDARLMVKASMKKNKQDKLLQRVLHSRQLGLKLIANVTYGYTAANFSGRMPAVEIGDSVVSKGRETLLRTIKLIENTPRWNARVVYGDTDSVFVLVAGQSKQTAFEIGAEIAEAVTNANPSPVKLKLEKIFYPCILQTKKRYVGYMYESPDQTEPEFCAKGIETVRRDGCPAVSKMLEKSLKLLFDTRDVSLVRKYVVRQFNKLFNGQVSLQDLTFAKEYRGASSYKPGACVPVLELTRKWLAADKRSEPRCGERVPYVIINGPPGLPLIKLVRSPREVLANPSLLPNVLYYITRVIIPPLNRCFLLIGADLNTWFNSMPRKQIRVIESITPDSSNKKAAISDYFSTTSCIACGAQTQQNLCINCHNNPQEAVCILQNKVRLWERTYYEIIKICQSCSNQPSQNINCISLDCPVFYYIIKATKDLQQVSSVRNIMHTALNLDM